MQLNIGQKIISVAAVVLVLMLVVAVYSIRLTAAISNELDMVATRHFPVTEAVARINVSILEQGVILQRLFVFAEEGLSDHEAATRAQAAFKEFGEHIDGEFASTGNLLAQPYGPEVRHSRNINLLTEDLGRIEGGYRSFESHGLLLLTAREKGERATFDALLPKLNALQDAIDAEIANLRQHAESLTSRAVRQADRDERALLITNSALTALATVLGLAIALIITRALVRSVRNLVAGTEQVERGDLDTEVPVTSQDEVGQLTGSFNHMVGELRLKERIKDTFGKYMDPRIVSNLLDHPEFAEPGGERREMSVMFIDLKGFTSISEKLPPDDLVRMVNGFFGHMTDAISSNKGVVDKFMGGAVMAFWGPPFTDPEEHALLACQSAIAALEHLERFRTEVAAEIGSAGGIEIDLRIGISSGEMVVGTIGSKVSMSYTVMGDPVNLGSRLEGANKAYGSRILVSERTRELAGDAVAVRELDLIRVKGKVEPTRIYELTGFGADATPALPAPAGQNFSLGLEAYRRQDWAAAETAFRACAEEKPGDSPSAVYLDRIDHLKTSPPPADWDGVWVFETK